MTTLTRQRIIMRMSGAMRYDNGPLLHVTFAEALDEPGTPRKVSVREQDWRDMGRPSTITLTIEPEDQLNT